MLGAGLLLVAPSTPAGAAFSARGSIKQIYTWGHPVGSTVELHDPSNNVIASGVADAQGAKMFRDLAPGTGYTVVEGGVSSASLTVTDPSQNPPDSFYASDAAAHPLGAGFGYVTTRDGTTLGVNVTMPSDGSPGPWPVLVEYSGYDPSEPNTTPQETQLYPHLGYVVVGVNMRGTDCSGGAFWFFEDAQRTDGYDVIESLAHQSWSNGDVGMVGISYSGYSQLYVAATHPPHLRAITPLSPFSDGYRGILYPGGILNDGFALNWALDRQEASRPSAHSWVRNRISNGDTTCAQNQVMRLQSQDLQSEIIDGRFDDPVYSYLDPNSFAPQIQVPTYLATQWDDEQTGGYGAELATLIAPHAYLRASFTNGTHIDSIGPEVFMKVAEFVDLYVGKRKPVLEGNGFYQQGVADGLSSIYGTTITNIPYSTLPGSTYADAKAYYESQNPIQIRWEDGGVTNKEGQPYTTVTTTYPSWPIPTVSPERWYLQPDAALSKTAPTVADTEARASSSYTYDPTTKLNTTFTGSTDAMWTLHPNVHWNPLKEGNSLSFTTPAYTGTTAYVGNGSADLWVKSSAVDTDFEVTLTEVRPDGKEVQIQSGWLRASRRALDVAGSTVLRPRQTFQAADAAPLPAGQFVPVRIEIFPFAQIVRAGSRLRLNIEAPGGNQPFWAFSTLNGTSTNSIGHSVGMPSSVVLPKLSDSRVTFYAQKAAPSCSVSGVTTQSVSLRNQPCRDYLPARTPTGVTAAVSGNRVNVSWTAPPTWASGPALTGYRVTASSGDVIEVPPGTTTTPFDASTSTPAGPLTFTVAAEYGSTVAPASDSSLGVTIPTATAVSAKPGNGNASVTWKAPTSTGPSIAGYTVTPYIGGVAQAPQSFNGTGLTQIVTGLTNGTAYTFAVSARFTGGNAGPSSSQSAAITVGAPGSPAFLSATPANQSATVKWWAPAGNGAPITGYVITPYIGLAAQTPRTFNSTATNQVITGLTNGTTYTFAVSAVNSLGTGPAAVSPAVIVNPTVAGAPTSVSAKTGNASAAVTWKAPSSNGGSAITGYVVTPYIGSTAQAPQTFNSTAVSQTVTGLTNGSTYTFTVAATNGVGTSPASTASAAILVGAPAAPAFLSATPANQQATVKWWAPAGNGGPVTGYVITPYIAGVAQAPRTFNSSASSQVVTGLTNGTTYTFSVAAFNAFGTGPSAMTPAVLVDATVAGAPTGVTAKSGAASASVTWKAPAADGGAAVTGYVVTPYIGATAQTPQTFNSTALTQNVTGLTNATSYTFKVAAINAIGTGAQSAASDVVVVGAPQAPAFLTATAGAGSVTLKWWTPANNGSAITGYWVTTYIGTTAQGAVFISPANSKVITGLTPGTAYTFTVAAVNANGTGVPSKSPAATPT
jgi:predicted acyl esterase